MTNEQIQKRHEEYIEIIKMLEQLVVTQQTTYQIHNERLQALRQLYEAVSHLKDLQTEQNRVSRMGRKVSEKDMLTVVEAPEE